MTYIPSYYDLEEWLQDIFMSISLVSKYSHPMIHSYRWTGKCKYCHPRIGSYCIEAYGWRDIRIVRETSTSIAEIDEEYQRTNNTDADKYGQTDAYYIVIMANNLPKLYDITVLEVSEPPQGNSFVLYALLE